MCINNETYTPCLVFNHVLASRLRFQMQFQWSNPFWVVFGLHFFWSLGVLRYIVTFIYIRQYTLYRTALTCRTNTFKPFVLTRYWQLCPCQKIKKKCVKHKYWEIAVVPIQNNNTTIWPWCYKDLEYISFSWLLRFDAYQMP